jgi:hypothetical protein
VIDSIICALLPVMSIRRMDRSEVSAACAGFMSIPFSVAEHRITTHRGLANQSSNWQAVMNTPQSW